MAITNKSNTEASGKDYWRTSPEIINDAMVLINTGSFNTDVCVSGEDVKIKKCLSFITEKQDALRSDNWFLGYGKTSFCNPPFTRKWEFFQKAVEQVNKWGLQVLMVMPYNPITQAWKENVSKANCIVYRPDGRYQFLLPDGTRPKNSCNFETCLILIVPFKLGCVTVDYKRGLYE